MNSLIEHAPTQIRESTSLEYSFDPGQTRKFKGWVDKKRRYSITVQNLSAAGSANYVALRTRSQVAVHRVLATESKTFVIDGDLEFFAPATNGAAITVAIMETEYTTRGVGGPTAQSASAPSAPSAPAGGSSSGGGGSYSGGSGSGFEGGGHNTP